ncbi:MAG: putative maltokinase, partial [Burkholderiales bacterium]|nr:putative maltokinase [Burkholderiales bacterium]
LCVANLGRSAQPVELDLKRYRGRVPVELLGRTPFPPIGELPYLLTLPAHGFYWFRLAVDAPVPHWHEEFLARDEAPVLVLFDGWMSLFPERVVPWRIGLADKARRQFETEVVARFIEVQRWYAAKGETVARAALVEHGLWKTDAHAWLLGLFEVEAHGEAMRYFVPLALAWEDRDEERAKALAPATLARVRQQAQVGVMADAFADESFVRALVSAVRDGLELPSGQGRIRFAPTRAFEEVLAGDDLAALPVVRNPAQTSNTGVSLGSRLFIKGYRRIRAGVNPEFEIGRYLTEVARFPHCVPVAGVVEHLTSEGEITTLALLQGYCSNQGDGWKHTIEYLERFVEGQRTVTEPPPEDVHGAYLALVHTLGQRTGELHVAFAQRSGDPAFDPEPVSEADVAAWRGSVHKEALDTLGLLERHRGEMPSPTRDEARALLVEREALIAHIEAAGRGGGATLKTRYHGDYHLGQVLLSKNDFLITDFEGEPARSLEERRAKHCALRDVAGMLRSFSYARWTAVKHASSLEHVRDGRLEALLARWERETRRAFLHAYEQAVAGSGLYGSFAAARGLLELFELEKALYELRYELGNRPGWAGIPLQGIVALAGGGLAGE